MSTARRIGIIGAGVAGLATAKTLVACGHDCVIFERGTRLGGVWAAGYSNFGLQVQRELYEFPDFPHAPETPDFTPGEQVQQYLERYARHFDVWPRIHFGTRVSSLRRDEKSGWVLTLESAGTFREERFDFVVVCTGLFSSRPHLPAFPGQAQFRGALMHISSLADRSPLAGKRVAVVGFGKSASDAALEAAAVAAQTTLIFRDVHWPVPTRLLGLLPFKWAMLNRLTSALLPPYYRPSMLERMLHTLGYPLVWLWWRMVEGLLVLQFDLHSRGRSRLSLVPRLPIEFDAFGEAVMLPRPEFYRALRDGRVEPVQTEIDRFDADGIILKNGRHLEADVVVLATGWESDHSWLDPATRTALGFEDDGLYLYRQMLPADVDGLAFIGYASTIASVLTYNLQAYWLAHVLDGALRLPPREDMRADIAAQKRWKRKCMPFSRGRAARLLLHMQHYHDDLMKDMGLSPLRKRGLFAPFKEAFAPYQPSDYRNAVSCDEAGELGLPKAEPGATPSTAGGGVELGGFPDHPAKA
ncbi:MAG: flavin-containing monooxygenase [Gammaproteobacteria bacterium]